MARPDGSIHDDLSAAAGPTTVCAPTATLEIASVRLPISSLKNSGAIVCAVVENPPPLWIDDPGTLRTDDETTPVRVVSLERLQAGDDSSAGGSGTFEICLRRSGEHVRATETGHRISLGNVLYATLTSLVPMEGSRPWSRRAMLAFLIAIPLVLGYIMVHGRITVFDGAIQGCRQAISRLVHRSDVPPPELPATVAADGPVAGGPMPGLEQSVRQSGVEPFLRPEVAAALKLTDVQLTGFRRLAETTRLALTDIDRFWVGESESEHAAKRAMVLDAARQQAVRMLTDEQSRKWRAAGGGR